jgi:hypothetical protein
MAGHLSLASPDRGLFPSRRASRRVNNLREIKPASPVIVYQAKKDPVTGKWINEPGEFKRIEIAPDFIPKFNWDASIK